ncbi:uncharacterized protein FIBRA_02348 [Fibroporia radiculosa]|uniref:PRELI/MSF1 domain-containing protein n=1 Tax=Fibroporia radiculosa TaxID=599839 RepID=J4G1M6_9APHY|nr:uncharacterized protein FIBRA_02348 [Fibroporia radiculosa]CCM00318.1 predicted protein [Fibroporia radiculosa]
MDACYRTVDPSTGVIRTERVLGCKQKAPGWIIKFFGGSEDAFVREISFVDPRTRNATITSVNLSLSQFATCYESIRYTPTSDGRTAFVQTAEIQSRMALWRGAADKLEGWLVQRFEQNAQLGKVGFTDVLRSCDVSRLREFIEEFYAQNSSCLKQNVDDAYCAFIWAVMSRQPGVRIGTVPEGPATEVYIAPQASAKRKAKAKGEEPADQTLLATVLNVVAEAAITPLEELKREYGSALRIAVDPEISRSAITGSHIRPSKLTPMVYTALQFITRGREQGISVLDLGRKSGYDQKTCFYLIKQLVELDLVVKRRKPGVSTNVCVHKYFFENSEVWQQVVREETKAKEVQQKVEEGSGRMDTDDEESHDNPPDGADFDPIDARHLSSLPVIRARLTKLLKSSPNGLHAATNLLPKIGFRNPTKSDRRFFQTRLRELIDQGVIEKVEVPHSNGRTSSKGSICIRLVTPEASSGSAVNESEDAPGTEELLDTGDGLQTNLSLHKQLVDLLDEAGMKGMTLNDLSASLCNFDRRTVELLLSRLEKDPPPLHLADLGIAQIGETHGRERRYKYYTVANFRVIAENEKLEGDPYVDVDLSQAGDFMHMEAASFYSDEQELLKHVSEYKRADDGDRASLAPSKSKKVRKNPILPDGTVKKGRPPKCPAPTGSDDLRTGEVAAKRGTKRKRSEELAKAGTGTIQEELVSPPTKRKRGRPPKRRPEQARILEVEVQVVPPVPTSEPVAPSNGEDHAPVAPSGPAGIDGEGRPAVVSGEECFPAKPSQPIMLSGGEERVRAEEDRTKRGNEEENATGPPAKRAKVDKTSGPAASGYYSKAKLTQSRREREITRLITDAGGILNISTKDFYEAHAALVESITQSGEVASTRAGSRIDKRTAEATLKELELREKVKIITTSVKTSTGSYRPMRIVYFPVVSESELNVYLAKLSRQQTSAPPPVKTLDEPLAFGGQRETKRSPLPTTLSAEVLNSKDPCALGVLFESGDGVIRDAFLAEKSTLAQLYGYIVGRAERVKRLHLTVVQELQLDRPSDHVVSREQRIVTFSYFLNDLPISTYCAIVTTLIKSEELASLLQSSSESILIGQVPREIYDALEVGRWRSKVRLLELFQLACQLHFMEPLQPSQTNQPPNAQSHPTTFDIVPIEEWTPQTAPVYWRFCDETPLHLWALSEHSPPFWKNVPTRTVAQCRDYWQELKRICCDKDFAIDARVAQAEAAAHTQDREVGKLLRKPSSWSSSYNFAWYQDEYLNRFVDKSCGDTPLQDQDGGEARLSHISWVVAAPKGALQLFFEKARIKYLKEQDRLRRRVERNAVQAKSKEAQDKALLARKAAEGKQQMEQDWDDLVRKVHPDALKGSAATRVRRVRSRYMQSSGRDKEKWEAEIKQALYEAQISAMQVLSSGKPPPVKPLLGPAPLVQVVGSNEKSVDEIIAQQGPQIAARTQNKKSKKGKGVEEGTFDSLMLTPPKAVLEDIGSNGIATLTIWLVMHVQSSRLAAVVAGELIPRNTVRQRAVHLREGPGGEAYMQRLEDKWYELWTQHRGTPALPDDDPESATNFDLVSHLKFLRNHVDKNALRVGYREATTLVKSSIPASVHHLQSHWDVIEKKDATSLWDFIWSGAAEEGRGKHLALHSFVANCHETPSFEYSEEDIYIAHSALKMTMGTPNETYDTQVAANLLRSVGEELVDGAKDEMSKRGVLSKTVRDPQKSKPGRTLKISESNQNALGGSVSQDIFQDACALEELLIQEDDPTAWREWSLLSSEGDVAALAELVSENKIDFKIDTSQPQLARTKMDWNSKKADDDDNETTLLIRLVSTSDSGAQSSVEEQSAQTPIAQVPSPGGANEIPADEHGHTTDGERAFCSRSTGGLIDCSACLQEAASFLVQESENKHVSLLNSLMHALRNAGSRGLSKPQLLAIVGRSQAESAYAIIEQLTAGPVPVAFWTGYISIVLVSCAYIRPWTVLVSDGKSQQSMVSPRRWLDIFGGRMRDIWQAALRAVIGVVLYRPGIPQAEIRWRLRAVYDRQEVNDALSHLVEEGYIVRHTDATREILHVGPPDDDEESYVFYVLAHDKHWYRL